MTKGFIDRKTPCPFELLDTQVEEFIDTSKVGEFMHNLVKSYEDQRLPTKEDFTEIQKKA